MSEKLTIGQTIVYPAYGVVNIQGIEEKEICDSKKSFYILKIIENNATLMVPTDNASSLGLRPIISRKEVPNILKILGKKPSPATHLVVARVDRVGTEDTKNMTKS